MKKADKILKAYRHSQDAFAQSREDSEKAMRYVNNDSWSNIDKTNAEKHKKPVLKYNIIMPIISTLMGNEQLNRKRARFVPTTLDSVDSVDVIQGRWNAINDEQDMEEKLQTVFMDALIMKMGGWIERSFVVNKEGYLDFEYAVADSMRVYLDPETKTFDYNLKNCRWVIKEGWDPLDVLAEKYEIPYSTLKEGEEKAGWWNQLSSFFKRFKDSEYSTGASKDYDKENDRYKVLEMQERVYRKMYKVWDGGEGYFDMTPGDFRVAKKQNNSLMRIREYDEEKIHITTIIPYFSNVVVMDEDSSSPVANFDVFPIFSYNLTTQACESTALVDLLMDVQDDVNKGKSQVRDYVTQIISGGVFIDKREKETIKRLKTKGNQPNQVYELNNPQIIPQRLSPGTIPPDIMLNTENSVQYAQRVSLVSEAMKGETGRSGESGVLFQKKIERAAAAINPYYKALANLRKTIAKDFVDNFGFVYSEYDRVVKIKPEGGAFADVITNLAWAGEILNNVTNASLYVELDEGEDNVTAKEENFEKMLAMINVIGQINPAFVDVRTLIENAPLKGRDKMLEYIDQVLQSQQEGTESQTQLANSKELLEQEKLRRGMVNDEEKLRIEAAKASKGEKKN